MSLGGYVLTGSVSVLVCATQAAAALTLPPQMPPGADDEEDDSAPLRSWLSPLREGAAVVARCGDVRHTVLLAAVLPAFEVFDEYFPLLAGELGVALVAVPLLIAVATIAETIGGVVGGYRAERTTRSATGVIVAVAAVLLATGALSGHAAGFAGVAIGYGLMQLAAVVVETRLQHQLSGSSRATVTSLTGLLSELLAIMMYAWFAVGSSQLTVGALMAALAGALLATAVLVRRWLPAARPTVEVVDPGSA